MKTAILIAVRLVGIAAITALIPPGGVWAASMFAKECAQDTQKAALWISAGGAAVHTALPKLGAAAADIGLVAVSGAAKKANPVVAAVTAGAEAGTAAGSAIWRLSQGFWSLLGNKDPSPAMPDPFQPTVLQPVDINQIYAIAGINPTDVADVASVFPFVQTTFNIVGDSANYDAALTAFTTAYTKYLEASLGESEGGPNAPIYAALMNEHAAEIREFAPILQAASEQLASDGAAEQAAWNQFWTLYTSVTGLPNEFTDSAALAYQTDLATNGFPSSEVAIMNLLGVDNSTISGLAQDSLNISSDDLANLNFADQSSDCEECDREAMNSILAQVPEPSTLLLVSTGFVSLLGYGWRRRRLG